MKLSFLAGLGAGYVLGTRSGRKRYDQITEKARGLWSDPRVQEKAGQAKRMVNRSAQSGSGPGSATGTGNGSWVDDMPPAGGTGPSGSTGPMSSSQP
jgi:hypothetical protein